MRRRFNGLCRRGIGIQTGNQRAVGAEHVERIGYCTGAAGRGAAAHQANGNGIAGEAILAVAGGRLTGADRQHRPERVVGVGHRASAGQALPCGIGQIELAISQIPNQGLRQILRRL